MKTMWTLGGLSWRQFALRLWENESDIFGRAAQLSYYFLLAFVPMLLCLTTLSGLVMGANSELTQSFLNYLSELMPPAAEPPPAPGLKGRWPQAENVGRQGLAVGGLGRNGRHVVVAYRVAGL